MDEKSQTITIIRPSVDYLTVTTKTSQAGAQLLSKLLDVLGSETLYHEKSNPWRFMGYSGRAFPSVRYGLRGQDEAIVMMWGDRCNELWREVAPYRERCTRIDLAVTVELQRLDMGVAAKAYEQALESGAVKASTVISSQGGSTTYLGSRQSHFYGRLYDKGAEEGTPPGWIWRYEAEVKKPASETLVQRLLESHAVPNWIESYIAQFFVARGIEPLWHSTNTECAIEIEAKVTSNDRALLWLRTQVRPTVGRLCIAGREEEVRDALGLPVRQLSFDSLKEVS